MGQLFNLGILRGVLRFHHFVDSFDFDGKPSAVLLVLLLVSFHGYLRHLQLLLGIFEGALGLPVVHLEAVVILPFVLEHLHPLELLLLQHKDLLLLSVVFGLKLVDLLQVLVDLRIFTFDIYFFIYQLGVDLLYLLFFAFYIFLQGCSNLDVLLYDVLDVGLGGLRFVQDGLVHRKLHSGLPLQGQLLDFVFMLFLGQD